MSWNEIVLNIWILNEWLIFRNDFGVCHGNEHVRTIMV